MPVEVFDFEQGSADWYAARLGLPTASRFADILAKGEGKMRDRYLRDLAGEVITGELAESYSNGHMDRGKEQEAAAREHYAFITDVEPRQVGFLRNGRKGCSPDSLIGQDGGLEIKTALPAIQIERLRLNRLPPEHKAQVQGNLYVSEREWWDFTSFCPRLPALIVRVYRDDAYIANLAKHIDAFTEELDALVDSIRTYENFHAAAAA